MITVPDNNPSLLILPTIQDATLTINLNVTIQKWCPICHSIITVLSGAAISMTSLLQVSQSFTLSHYLFLSSKKLPPTYREANQAPEGTPPSKKKLKAYKGTSVLQPEGNLSLKDILSIKDKGNITNPRIPVMKGIHNTKVAAPCLLFLLGGHCDSTYPCGYHLQVNDPDRLPGTSNVDYEHFHDWMATSKSYACLITSSYQNSNLDLS